jgi:outer membrane receptor protein involved in Fe transport
MQKRILLITVIVLCLVALPAAFCQSGKGILSGVVTDSAGSVLQGAKVELQPQIRPITTDGQGEFTVTEIVPGTYGVTVSYVGFTPFTGSVTVVEGQTAHIEAVLKVGSANDQVIVTADRPHGEAEAINRTLAAENILQVLPADVIVSLPNANIADALGRMASVTIERDEGEGKYVQIRGTEPRLSNTMIDGVTVPSPESGVRQIKLDTIASDLVDSVEINKTLQANIDADGIGGSVNLVTKTAGEQPTATLYGVGGYTPIIGGRTVDQMGGTVGKRFLADKKLGLLIGGTYDFNGRGINDLEPDPQPNPDGSMNPYYDTMDLRDYIYYRTRWGMTASADYKMREGSNISIRGLFSTFRNWGNKWTYTMQDGKIPKYSQDWRRPNMAIGNLALQGKHVFNASTILWGASVGRARSLGGSGGGNFAWAGDPNIGDNCHNIPGVSVNRPGWSAGCFGTGADNAVDSNNYNLTGMSLPTYGQSVQLNLQASASYSRLYHFGSHFGTFEFGGKIRNAHKFDDTYGVKYAKGKVPVSAHPELASNFTDPDYYDKTYHIGPVTAWPKVESFVLANQGLFTKTGTVGSWVANSANYDLIERIPAGYLMNTIELSSRVRFVAGLRIEATHVSTLSYDATPQTVSFKAGGDYMDLLPSASLRFALDKNSDLRLVYGRGLARPDPQDISAAVSVPVTGQDPNTVSVGNPNLKAEYANNYDILYERYLTGSGLIQAGYFYKDLSDPIISVDTTVANTPYNPNPDPVGAKTRISQPGNGGSAHVQGVEFGFQQRFSHLPGMFRGAGLSANYSYTSSQANGLPGRSDSPALLRQAPNSWNISPTFDTRHFSMRVGMTFDDKMIYAYQWTDNADPTGIHGPLGDNYLYPHYQFDTQASYRLPLGFEVYAYGLNLNNEVFGFYNGSPQYVVQREYYHPTYAGGLRWTSSRER